MRSAKFVILVCSIVFLVPACCCPPVQSGCCHEGYHEHVEPPFDIPKDGPPGPGLVYGTADFDSSGAVLIKIQVENLASEPGNQADITVWSGQGTTPTDETTPPPGGTEVYSSDGDVALRYWTTHLDRSYDPATDKYWLFAVVDHNDGGGNRNPRYLVYEWTPSATMTPDSPAHDFDEVTSP